MVKRSVNRIPLFFLFLIFGLMLFLPVASAESEWDNVKEYDADKREVRISNSFLKFWTLDEVARIQLITPDIVYVAPGYTEVAKFKVSSRKDYSNVFNNMKFIDLKRSKEVEREFDYKMEVVVGQEVIQNYTDNCRVGKDINGSLRNVCSRELFNEYTVDVVELQDVNKRGGLPKGEHIISIWTNVENGDVVDWIPTFYGVEIEEWAVWTSDLTVGLKSYNTLNESSLPMIDSAPEGLHTTSTEDNTPVYGLSGGRNASYMGLDASTPDGINLFTYNNSGVKLNINWTVSVWWNSSDGAQHSFGTNPVGDRFLMKWNGANDRFDLEVDAISISSCTVTGMSLNSWHNFIALGNSSGMFIYADGTLCASSLTPQEFPESTPFWLGCASSGSTCAGSGADAVTGGLDEFAVWNRSITSSEITAIASGITFAPTIKDDPPVLNLTSPLNDTLSTVSTVVFNWSVEDEFSIANSTLHINGVRNITLFPGSATNETTFQTSVVLSDGVYNWTASAFDNSTKEGYAPSNFTLSVDATPPEISIPEPNGTISYFILGNNETLNTTITDINLDSCWYEYAGVNTSISCVSGIENIISFLLLVDEYSLTVYANDSLGSESMITTTWEYQVLETANIFNTPAITGSTENFQLDVNTSESVVSAILIHNNTSFTTNLLSLGGDAVQITSTIQMPFLTTNANISFNYNVTLSSGAVIETNSSIQQIIVLEVGSCASFSDLIFNMSLFDERTLADINGTIEFDLEVSNVADGSLVSDTSITFDNVHEATVCSSLNITTSDYVFALELRYFSSPDNGTTFTHVPEFYHIQAAPVANLPQTIPLFDLNINESTEFTISYKDDNYIARENVLLQILRKYVGEGIFRTVEIPITSSEGLAVGHFDLNNYKYKIIATQDGVVLNVFDNPSIRCESELTGICEIFLRGLAEVPNADFVSNQKDFFYLVAQTNDSIIIDYSVPSGSTKTTNIQMVQISAFQDPITLCNQTIVSSAGSVTCTINPTIGDSAVEVTILSEGVNQANLRATFQEDLQASFLLNNYFIAIVLLMSLILMFISSTRMMIGASIFGLIFMGLIFLLKTSSITIAFGAISWLILAVIIILAKLNKKEEE